MGGRGSSSATAVEQSRHVAAGGYPASMESLVDGDGRVSLDPSDYAQYTRDEIEAFLVSRDYETAVVFSPDGEVVDMTSQWDPADVTLGPERAALSIYRHGSRDGNGYVDFHTHPNLGLDEYAIFSTGDIDSYVEHVDLREKNGDETPDTFAVRASDGHSFQLRYVGGSNYWRFGSSYAYEARQAIADAAERYSSAAERIEAATARLDKWLRENASKYGFEYKSNWIVR